jgi:hypothetical protein
VAVARIVWRPGLARLPLIVTVMLGARVVRTRRPSSVIVIVTRAPVDFAVTWNLLVTHC